MSDIVEYRKIESGPEARKKIIGGVNALANPVKSTLGPNGRTVLIEQNERPPIATKDGVTVAQNIKLGESVANLAAQVIKEAANNANKLVGDGTTTATVMVQALFASLKDIPNEMAIPEIREGMEAAKDLILAEVNAMAVQIHDHKDRNAYLKQIATISSNNDPEIPEKVMEAFKFIGEEGALKVDLGRLHHSHVTKSEGMVYNSGMVHSVFATDIKKTIASLKNPLVFLTDHNIDYVSEIQDIFEYARSNNRDILVVAADYTDAAQMSFYKMKDVFKMNVCCVKAPGFGNQRADILEDIGIMVGAMPIIKGSGTELLDVPTIDTELLLGSAEKISVTFEDFTIINGKGGKDVIDGRVEMLKEKMQEEEDGYLKDQLASRIAKLVHGVAVIYVGAESEFDAREKMDRYVDAVKAVKSAVKSGIVPGGGIALARAAKMVSLKKNHAAVNLQDINQKYSETYLLGFNSVTHACIAPIKQIIENAYIEPMPILKHLEKENFEKGYNVKTKKYEDFISTGVIDPAMVATVSLNNAVSIASTLMGTDHVIYNHVGKPETYE